MIQSPTHLRRCSSTNSGSSRSTATVPESLQSSFCNNFLVTLCNKIMCRSSPGIWSQGSWHCRNSEYLVDSCNSWAAYSIRCYYSQIILPFFFHKSFYRGWSGYVNVSFPTKREIFQSDAIYQSHQGQSFTLSEMRNNHWSHGIIQVSSSHIDPQLSTLLMC